VNSNRFGWRESPHDVRDWPLGRFGVGAVRTVPDSIDRGALVEAVYLQDGPSCTGWGIARGWHLRARLQGDRTAPFPCAPAIYGLARAREVGPEWKDPLPDVGAYVRQGLDAVNECGVLHLEGWAGPRDRRPPWRALQASADHRGLRYARCWSTDEIRLALAAGYPVVIGHGVDQAYADYRGGIWPGLRGPAIGGHCTCLLDYTPDAARGVNSWDVTWGEAGLYRMAWPALIGVEAFAVELVPAW
jgi:hypothetical protein